MFYTYLWLREDGTPYYVGKGHGDRAYTRVGHKQKPPSIGRMVFYIARDEAEAFENEIALIWYYGRKDLGTGCLRNLTDGGEGFTGKHTDETRLKMSQNNARYWSGKTPPAPSADNIEKRSKALQGNKNSLGFVHTEESIQKRIASLQQNLKYKTSTSSVRQRNYRSRLQAEGKERLGRPELKNTPGAIRQRRYRLKKFSLEISSGSNKTLNSIHLEWGKEDLQYEFNNISSVSLGVNISRLHAKNDQSLGPSYVQSRHLCFGWTCHGVACLR